MIHYIIHIKRGEIHTVSDIATVRQQSFPIQLKQLRGNRAYNYEEIYKRTPQTLERKEGISLRINLKKKRGISLRINL